MLLSQISTSSVSSSTAKQITIPSTSEAGAVMYSVPTGRKFVGNIFNQNNGYSTNINGVTMYCYHGSSSYVAQAGALHVFTLLSGTVVKEVTANSSYIIGVETDA